jgi:hypothetical protein
MVLHHKKRKRLLRYLRTLNKQLNGRLKIYDPNGVVKQINTAMVAVKARLRGLKLKKIS